MGIKVVTPPATEPVTLAEAKLNCAVDYSDLDALFVKWISAARELAEQEMRQVVPPTTFLQTLDAFPVGAIQLKKSPLISVDWIRYVDPNGALQTLSGTAYFVDDTQIDPWICEAYGTDWPATRDQANAVQIQFQAGFTQTPARVWQFVQAYVGTMMKLREASDERPAQDHPFIKSLLDDLKVHPL
jgi:uncharacterized phiE125 gp8 family phage protein